MFGVLKFLVLVTRNAASTVFPSSDFRLDNIWPLCSKKKKDTPVQRKSNIHALSGRTVWESLVHLQPLCHHTPRVVTEPVTHNVFPCNKHEPVLTTPTQSMAPERSLLSSSLNRGKSSVPPRKLLSGIRSRRWFISHVTYILIQIQTTIYFITK